MKRSGAKSGRPGLARTSGAGRQTDHGSPARRPGPGLDPTFLFLLGAAWVGVAVLSRTEWPWLYAAIGVAVVGALWVGRRQTLPWRVFALLALALPAWQIVTRQPAKPASQGVPVARVAVPGAPDDDVVIRSLVADEETLLVLARKMDVLSRALLDLRLPGPAAAPQNVFGPSVMTTDLGPIPEIGGSSAAGIESRPWPLAGAAETSGVVDLWRPLFDAVSFFEHARTVLVSGEHPAGDAWRFEATAHFHGLARMKSGTWCALDGRVKLDWERSRTPEGGAGEWQIAAWHTEALKYIASPRRLFVEVLEAALRPPQDPRSLRRSQHYEATVRYYREGMKQLPHPYFAPISVNHKEGLAVADINGDGWDDLYITVRIGKNLLLINHGDGTFTEASAAYGLDLPGHTTCALFADFDNDGDLDALLGRSLLRTSYLENRGGRFYQPPIPKWMPMAVISMAAADYNGDGLLDVYLSTYRPAAPAGSGGGYAQAAKEPDFDWPDEFFSPELAREFRRRLKEHQQKHGVTVLDQLGPPNMLLVNRGGGQFEPAPENPVVGLWRNSLQATWCDYNHDGRPDLYIPNDWGLNVLLRNEGPAGFKEVTHEAGLTRYGFSMGASWGDFDNDEHDDLYVSNMYSDAGRRLTARIPGLNPLFAESAAGNFLYHGLAGGRFEQIAGLAPPAMTVQQVGWSWGGCFADFDNDAFLDLYVLSGYFTAPAELASGLDLESNLWRTMVRSDENLARPSFRYSPEWKRTPPPDNLGPEIDARLAGVERQGGRIVVHSLHGAERNRYFANRGGRSFVEISALTGLDNPADSRGFAVWDYDRDGWQDVALVNANQPLLNLYRNEMPAAGVTGGVIALRFVGGNRTAASSREFACRDGFGARVAVDLGDQRVVREHRCGEGWSTQNSATMLVGIGAHPSALTVSVRWPSGKTTSITAVPEGTLLTAYENAADSPSGEAFVRQPYRMRQTPPPARPVAERPVFAARAMDAAAKPARLRVYTSFATSSAACILDLPLLQLLKEELGAEGVDVIAIPIDPSDDNPRLGAFARERKPASRLVNLPAAQRPEVAAAFAQALGFDPPLPSAVVTDATGHILAAQPGVPSLSELRRLLASDP